MFKNLLHSHSPYRIFAFSVLLTIAGLVGVGLGINAKAVFLTLTLIVIELTFSFDNAIINAKILEKLSRFWQNMFLSVGIVIAVFGMRVIFPIAIVALTAGLGWHEVLNLALNNPSEYADKLHSAHPLIAAFGGGFLITLALGFFADKHKKIHWFKKFETFLQKYIPHGHGTPIVALAIVAIFALIPANHHVKETLLAGAVGVIIYSAIHTMTLVLSASQAKRKVSAAAGLVGVAAFTSFLYLELLDASFSLDGVIGAFAITTNVVLIAIGLGIGAIWVRSFTVFLMRKQTLGNYIYLEHGAHYTIAALALTMFISVMLNLPEYVAGSIGIIVVGSSVVASAKARKSTDKDHAKVLN